MPYKRLFIDIDKAYDSVWRECLMYKLYKLGTRGRVWKWIKMFLYDRRVVINMSGEKGHEYNT